MLGCTCTGRVTAGPSTGRSARISTRATCRGRSRSSIRRSRNRRRPRPRGCRSASWLRATSRRVRSCSKARVSSPWMRRHRAAASSRTVRSSVRGNRIESVGPSGRIRVPAGATRVDVRGRTIIPGLIDVHAHVNGEDDGLLAEQSWPLVANLAYGVTTAHDPSNDTETVFANSELVRAGRKLSPRLFSTGTILYGAELPLKAVVENYDDALAHLRRMKAVGAFSVKSYNQQRRDVRQMIVKAARELQMMVVPEGASLLFFDETLASGRAHRRRARAPRGPRLPGRHSAVCPVGRWLHADAHRGLRRAVWRDLLVSARRGVEEPAAADLHAARHHRQPVTAAHDGGRRRFQSPVHRAQHKAAARRRCPGAARRARPAAGPRRALGAVDARAGRDDAARGAEGWNARRGAISRPRQGSRLARSRASWPISWSWTAIRSTTSATAIRSEASC